MAVRRINGTWYLDFRFKFRRYRKKSPFATKGGAEQYEQHLKQQLMAGKDIDEAPAPEPKLKTLGEFMDQWFESYVAVNNKPSEIRTKHTIADAHLMPFFGEMPLRSIDITAVSRFKQRQIARGLSNKTVNNHLAVLRRCLRSAVEVGVLDRMPVVAPLPTPPPDTVFLSDEEVNRLLADRREPAWHRMVRTAVRTGMRLGELLALDWDSVDFARGFITVRRSIVRGVVASTKSNRIRFVPMPRDLAAELVAAPREGPLVFERPGGGFRTDGMATRALERLCRRTDVRRIGWHKLRHTFASQLATRGVSAHTIKKLLGHSTLLMTERYMHLAPLAFEDARSVLDQLSGDEVAATPSWAPGGQQASIVSGTARLAPTSLRENSHEKSASS